MKYEADEIKINITDLVKTKPREAIIAKLGLDENRVKNFETVRSSLDSRFHNTKGIYRVFCVRFDYDGHLNPKIAVKAAHKAPAIQISKAKTDLRPVVVGAGPAGLFAALRFIEYGLKPLVIEMGKDIPERNEDIKRFWETGALNPYSNVQFGLGGAGTFSDGKLLSRIKSPYAPVVLERFVDFGAKKEILYLNKPHLGTDCLKKIVASMRDHIIENGGSFMFDSRVTGINTNKGAVCSVIVNDKDEIPCTELLLACGNAARSTYEMLNKAGVAMAQKPFAVGVRVEHAQKLIDEYTFGRYVGFPGLSAADYKLTFKDAETGRGVYTFCNCPGGYVINASTEEGLLAVNGMSYSGRKAENANSAVVVSVGLSDFNQNELLSPVEFQRDIERGAFMLGGGNYTAPVMNIADFIGVKSAQAVTPSIMPKVKYADIANCFPEFVTAPLKRALADFTKRIPGFESGVMTAAETRTSSPLRITRDKDTLESISLKGLYPVGEGAGYAGGILSSAVDGMKAADAVMKKYN